MLEMNHRTEMARRAESQTSQSNKQNLRLVIALSILLVALTVVLVKDREFWFGSEQATEPAAPENIATTKTPEPAKAVAAPVSRPATAKHSSVTKRSNQPTAAAPAQPEAATQSSPIVAANRVVLPPLDVEVVAGDTHHTVRSGSNATKVEIPSDSNRSASLIASANLPADAAQRERLSTVSAPDLRANVDANYPLLGQHMKVQGSVVLQAVIGADGVIENLRVVSGPAILATAAQQAVRQWHFKPYLQNGQPVETKTRITVNFSIRVADTPSTTS
jgi:TonB family protein